MIDFYYPPEVIADATQSESISALPAEQYQRYLKEQVSKISGCVKKASLHFGIAEKLLLAILDQEQGLIGMAQPVARYTYDLGPFQVNSMHLPEIQQQFPLISWKSVAYNACVNAFTGAAILSHEIAKYNNVWAGVGAYHHAETRDSIRHHNYKLRVIQFYERRLNNRTGITIKYQTTPYIVKAKKNLAAK